QGGGDIRVVRVRLALELAELRVFTDVDFDLGVATEAERAGAVVTLPLLQDASNGGGVAVQRALHAGGKIGDDEQRLRSGRRLHLEAGECGTQEQHDQGAQSEREPRALRCQWRRKEP